MNLENLNKTQLIEEIKLRDKKIEEFENQSLDEFSEKKLTEVNEELEVVKSEKADLETALDTKTEESDGLKDENESLTEKLEKAEQQKDDSEEKSPKVIVIPYVKRFAQGNELRHAIRGWAKNFTEEHRIVVVGDSEPWFGEDILHIPHECKTKNPPLDIAAKLQLVIACEDVPEEFIWSNDDIYAVNSVSMADLKFLKCIGNLKSARFGETVYQKNKKRTFELLKDLKRSTHDYGTHLPFVFEKFKLQVLIDKYKIDKEPYLVSSLYFNFFYPEMIPFKLEIAVDNLKCGVYRTNPDVKVIARAFSTKKFINNSQTGHTSTLVKQLDKCFSKKCRFEK